MILRRPVLRFFLDEGVDDLVGESLERGGHLVFYLNRSFERGSPDPRVCDLADEAGAILVAIDSDMNRIAQGHGVSRSRFMKIGLLKLSCRERLARHRVASAMSLIEHEWNHTEGSSGRRLFVEIGDQVIRTFR